MNTPSPGERPVVSRRRRYVPRLVALARHTFWVVSLSPQISGVWTHWDRDRPPLGIRTAHTRPGELCHFCRAGQRPRWCAYLPVWSDALGCPCLLELTQDCVYHCRDLHPQLGVDLTGRQLRVWRDGTAHTSPVRCSVEGSVKLPHPRPDVPVVAEELCRYWGVLPDALVLDDLPDFLEEKNTNAQVPLPEGGAT